MKLTKQLRTIGVRVLSEHWYVDIEVQAFRPEDVVERLHAQQPLVVTEITPRGNVIVHAA